MFSRVTVVEAESNTSDLIGLLGLEEEQMLIGTNHWKESPVNPIQYVSLNILNMSKYEEKSWISKQYPHVNPEKIIVPTQSSCPGCRNTVL